MKRWIMFIGLMLLGVAVYAADTGATINPGDFSNYQTPAGDLSLQYLGLLFGQVSSVLNSTDGSGMMGQLFHVLNNGILIVAGIWLGYSALNIAFTAAHEGGLGQSQRKLGFVFLRMALGFALIFPSATGYSGIQDVVMKVVVESVALADNAWSYALDYMQDKGFLYPELESSATSASPVSELQRKFTEKNGPVYVTLSNLMCMYISDLYAKNSYSKSEPLNPQGYRPRFDSKHGIYYFPGYGNSSDHYGNLGNPARCGIMTVPMTGLTPAEKELASTALQQFVMDLMPFAQQQAQRIYDRDNTVTATERNDAGSQVGYAAVMDFYGLERNVAQLQASNDGGNTSGTAGTTTGVDSNFFDNAKKRGWFAAGEYFWDLSMYNDQMNIINKVDVKLAPSGNLGVDTYDSGIPGSLKEKFNLATQVAADVTNATHNLLSTAQANATGASGNQISYHGSSEYSASDSSLYNGGSALDFRDLIPDAIAQIAGVVANAETAPTTTSHAYQSEYFNPISFVMHLGVACLNAAGGIWQTGADTIFGVAAVAGICSAISPAATILQSFLSWSTPLLMSSALGLFVAGFMMAFYAPLYPYLLFLFGTINWLILVLEAMVAAPLVCFGMTHPEGHDFLGKAEQALMLMLGLFLRPVLIVLGFIAAIILSYVSFAIVNYGFSHVLRELFNNFIAFGTNSALHLSPETGASVYNAIMGVVTGDLSLGTEQGSIFSGHEAVDLMLIPLMFVLYGFIVVEVVNQSFSLIHALPDQVMRWIGGPVQQDRTEQMASKVGQASMGAAKQVGEIGGQAQLSHAAVNAGSISSTAAVGATAVGVGQSAGGGGGAGGGE